MMAFEREGPALLPPYAETVAIPGKSVSHMKVQAQVEEGVTSDLVITGEYGGYVAGGYALFENQTVLVVEGDKDKKHKKPEEEEGVLIRQWYLNPFHFLRTVLGEENEPKPDVTTMNGRRIFYSHIDGDGWNNLTEIKKYKKDNMISAEVIYRDVLLPYPDIPVSVGVITSEMDLACNGLQASERVARRILALPHVEPASHTHSHPLFWSYFADRNPAKRTTISGRAIQGMQNAVVLGGGSRKISVRHPGKPI